MDAPGDKRRGARGRVNDETILEAIARVVYARGGRLVVFP